MLISTDIFKAYDIRGIVDQTLTTEVAYQIGRAIASHAQAQNLHRIAVGRDGRLSGPKLMEALTQGLREGGLDVFDIGMVATPMLYFAAIQHCNGSGVMITGSHNPPEYNGFKMMLGGNTLAGKQVAALHATIQAQNFLPASRYGDVEEIDIFPAYLNAITNHIHLKRPMNIVIDAGNGVAGAFAGRIYRALGCTVTELFCEVDGTFPNHHPDPAKPANLQDLITAVAENNAEVGLAFDGDGDRLGVVTPSGNIIYPDRQLMLFAQDVLQRNPGAKVIFDVKSTRLLAPWITQHGGVPIMEKTGHSFIKTAMKTHQAALAGEMSGHTFFKERWFGFDDGLYAGCRMLEILSQSEHPGALLDNIPSNLSTPELNIPLPQGENGHDIIAKLATLANFEDAQEIITIDGLRVEFADGFGLIRASNTTPVLVLRFEADSENAITTIQERFRQLIEKHSGLTWPL